MTDLIEEPTLRDHVTQRLGFLRSLRKSLCPALRDAKTFSDYRAVVASLSDEELFNAYDGAMLSRILLTATGKLTDPGIVAEDAEYEAADIIDLAEPQTQLWRSERVSARYAMLRTRRTTGRLRDLFVTDILDKSDDVRLCLRMPDRNAVLERLGFDLAEVHDTLARDRTTVDALSDWDLLETWPTLMKYRHLMVIYTPVAAT